MSPNVYLPPKMNSSNPKNPPANPPETPFKSKLSGWSPSPGSTAAVMADEDQETAARNKGKPPVKMIWPE